MKIGKHLTINIDDMFINYEIMDANQREWVSGRERKSFDQEQCLQQIIQLVKHKHEHYTLSDVELTHINGDIEGERFKRLLRNQISILVK